MSANLTFAPDLSPTPDSRAGPTIIRAKTPLRIPVCPGERGLQTFPIGLIAGRAPCYALRFPSMPG